MPKLINTKYSIETKLKKKCQPKTSSFQLASSSLPSFRQLRLQVRSPQLTRISRLVVTLRLDFCLYVRYFLQQLLSPLERSRNKCLTRWFQRFEYHRYQQAIFVQARFWGKKEKKEKKKLLTNINAWRHGGKVQSDYRVTSKAVRASNSFDSSVFLFLSLGLCCSFGVFPRKREIPFHHAILLRQIQQTLWPSRPRWKLNVRDFSVSSDTPLVNPIRFEPDAVSYDVR